MSHALPEPVRDLLTSFVCRLEEGLQADGHKVGLAVANHPAFDARWVESPLVRAVIAATAAPLGGRGLRVEELTNGGVEVYIVHERIERRFRVKRAVRDRDGRLDVRVSSDSLLAVSAQRIATLFDQDEDQDETEPPTIQRWVLAYLLHPGTRTLLEVSAGAHRRLQ